MRDIFSGVFYIYKTTSGNYNLCHRDTHYCLACGDYDNVLKDLENLVVRYKTPEVILLKIQSLSNGGRIAVTTLEERREVVRKGLYKKYEKDVNDHIQIGLGVVKESSTFNKVRKLLKKSPKRKQVVVETPEPSFVAPTVATQPKVGRLLVKKPSVFR